MSGVMRAALYKLSQIEMDESDPMLVCAEVRQTAREALGRADQELSSLSDDAVKYRLVLEKIVDRYGDKHHSPWCRLEAERALSR